MTLYPAAGLLLAIWLWSVSRSPDNGVRIVVAVIPFGMFAAVSFGGLSLLAANLLALFTITALILKYLCSPRLRAELRLPMSGLYLIAFALYSLFSAFVLVRIFQGEFSVFPVNVTTQATQVSNLFRSTMVPVQPTNSNISQSFYVLLSCGFFIAAVFVMRRRGTNFVETSLAWAAGLNATLGLLDFLGLDTLLSVIRTADYSLANEQRILFFDRTIGGYSEASAFGAVSAALTSYFATSFLFARRSRDGLLALSNLICASLAFSSTGFLALGAAAGLILLHAKRLISGNLTRTAGHLFVICCASLIILSSILFMLGPVQDAVSGLADQLFFSKRESYSGVERAAWARAAFDVFFETWGLGAGIGSLRGSGFFSVLLGSVGLPGTIAFMAFFFHALRTPPVFTEREACRTFYASRICSLTLFASMVVSAGTPDPTLLLVTVLSLAVSAKETVAVRSEVRSSWRSEAI